MKISILTVFPELYESFLSTSLVKRAQENKIVHVDIDRFSSFVLPKERIDAPTFGPGPGMLIRPEVVQKAVEDKEKKYGPAYKIFFSPQGQKLDQRKLEQIASRAQQSNHVMLLSARYEGMDVRVEQEYADDIISVGDFVLMGGDIPAMMLLEGMLRLIPGVVGKEESVKEESFTGPFVDYPQFTEPVEWKGKKVPDVVRSGNHAAINEWRTQQAVHKSVREHFSWLRSHYLTTEQCKNAKEYVPSHYVALVHGDVLIGKEKKVGSTSVTSIDLHDIARSSATYGVSEFFVVTPLVDQQKIVRKLIDFWSSDHGIEYNKNRHQAVQLITIKDTIEQAIDAIEAKEGKKPLVIATSARPNPAFAYPGLQARQVSAGSPAIHPDSKLPGILATEKNEKHISFYDQTRVWQQDRPVLLLFGTGQGLRPECIKQCDFQLLPVYGLSDFNHLSVRSAVAAVLDRWLGINPKSF